MEAGRRGKQSIRTTSDLMAAAVLEKSIKGVRTSGFQPPGISTVGIFLQPWLVGAPLTYGDINPSENRSRLLCDSLAGLLDPQLCTAKVTDSSHPPLCGQNRTSA